jgi:hypothetical protein
VIKIRADARETRTTTAGFRSRHNNKNEREKKHSTDKELLRAVLFSPSLFSLVVNNFEDSCAFRFVVEE